MRAVPARLLQPRLCAVNLCGHRDALGRGESASLRPGWPSSVGCRFLEPQVPKEGVDRKPVGGTKMDKDILARTAEQLRSRLTHRQVVSGREFRGRPFKSKPRLVHFTVSPRALRAADGARHYRSPRC